MNRIIYKVKLSENVVKMCINAPLIARECSAGQFVILSLNNELSERIPLTIADFDKEKVVLQ